MLEVKVIDSDDNIAQLIDMVVESGYKYCKIYYNWLNSRLYENTRMFVAIAEGRVVGCYAIHQQEFTFDGHSFKGAFGTQAVVHPRYRNLETIVSILKFVESWGKDNGIDFIYAIPNQNMAPIKKKLMNWTLNAGITEHAISRSEFLLSSGCISAEDGGKVERVLSSSVVRDLLVGLNRHESQGLSLVTNPNWFVNRYIENPKEHYLIYYVNSLELKELYVFKSYPNDQRNRLHIVDYFSNSGLRLHFKTISHSLRAILSWFSFDEVTFWDSCGPEDVLNSELLCKTLSDHGVAICSRMKIIPFMGMSDAF